jgi:Zn-dependent peptidase ImmA (M78 family)
MIVEGRKHFNALEIENKTIQLLQYYRADYFQYVRPTPLLDIAQFLSQKHDIIFNFETTLGFSENGQRILGAFNPRKRIVLIDSSLKEDEHKFNFTLAHEMGHLALHRNVTIKYGDINEKEEISETIDEFIFGNKKLRTEVEWLEWQANSYASFLLMPKEVFHATVIMKQRELGISRVGKIYVDEQACNKVDFFNLITLLSAFFKVSRSAVEYRLSKLNLIDDQRKQFKSIQNLLGDINNGE